MKSLIDGKHPGLLTTVDADNRPHARWMATFAFEEFPYIYTLTAPDSRKLEHISENPRVEWVFSHQNLSLILNLSGAARKLTRAADIKRVWRMVEDKSHAYFLKNFREQPGFAVLETLVTRVECTVPRSGFRWSVDVDSLQPTRPRRTASRKAA
jgi:general stress protein 26